MFFSQKLLTGTKNRFLSLLIFYFHSVERDLLSYYFPVADAVVLVIDAQDQDRFEEAKKYLDVNLQKIVC